jgi:hypothetical protein
VVIARIAARAVRDLVARVVKVVMVRVVSGSRVVIARIAVRAVRDLVAPVVRVVMARVVSGSRVVIARIAVHAAKELVARVVNVMIVPRVQMVRVVSGSRVVIARIAARAVNVMIAPRAATVMMRHRPRHNVVDPKCLPAKVRASTAKTNHLVIVQIAKSVLSTKAPCANQGLKVRSVQRVMHRAVNHVDHVVTMARCFRFRRHYRSPSQVKFAAQ